MSATLKLLSLNIERAKYLERVIPFLRQHMPDIACFQEVREPDIPLLQDALGAGEHVFTVMHHHPSDGYPAIVGTCIISRLRVLDSKVEYYHGDESSIPHAIQNPEDVDDAAVAASVNCALSSVDVEKEGIVYRIATTHLIWSRKGRFTPYQRDATTKLLTLLDAMGEFVLVGDFNAPRGGEIFTVLAAKYKDNIPPQYKTSLDVSLHRSGKMYAAELGDKMVDGLFSTPEYLVSDVELVSGVSDHCAIVANVSKISA